jgi:hypothetical protein
MIHSRQVFQRILLLICLATPCLAFMLSNRALSSATTVRRSNSRTLLTATLDSRELTKIFGRFAAKSILLDIPGAGTPEMANCCHGGCDNCNYSHSFDNLSAGRAKWVPTYSTRTLIDGRSEKAPWANIFDSPIAGDGTGEAIDKATFIERIQQLPYEMSMGPGSSVPADETPLESAVEAFWDILLLAVTNTGDIDSDANSTGLLDAQKVFEFTALCASTVHSLSKNVSSFVHCTTP